jgi:hypothetical protein
MLWVFGGLRERSLSPCDKVNAGAPDNHRDCQLHVSQPMNIEHVLCGRSLFIFSCFYLSVVPISL